MAKSDIKLLIFDFDLTLVDSKGVAIEARKILFEEHGVSFAGIPESELWGHTFKINSVKAKNISKTNLSAEEIEEILIENCAKNYHGVPLNSKKTLKEWQDKGIKMCIVSGNTKELIDGVLEDDCNKEINFVYVFETNSGCTKAQRLLECIKKIGCEKSEAIYVGDHINDILAAKESGVASCAVTTGFHTKDDFLPYEPDMIIDKLEELNNYI
jgi:HAD superfamily hydrolase (TIGR01549 family)